MGNSQRSRRSHSVQKLLLTRAFYWLQQQQPAFLEVENNCVKKERVVNTNGKTHLLLTRCLALLFCTVKILLSKSNETDELTYQKKRLSKMHVQCGRKMMVQFELLDEIGPLIYLHPVANTESMRNENNSLPRHFWPRTRLFWCRV